MKGLLQILAVVALLATQAAAESGRLVVFAAASLKEALDEVNLSYADTSGVAVAAAYAASSALARQIQRGAPAGVFISASVDWMDALAASGDIDPESRVDLLSNSLVIVGQEPASALDPADLPSLLDDGRLAMALANSVPAGIYARQALAASGLWSELGARTVQTDNVRAALALVARGEAPYGIVYATDALAEPRVTVVARLDPALHDPIVYPAAVVTGASAEARTYVTYLSSPPARAIFARHGFGAPQ